jgi:BirA family biotin operon repressor/biotin-[acetyl-CoA-carboxylase] ligase
MSGFDSALFEAERAQRKLTLGQPVSWREETQSTNDDALLAARNGARHGALFGAEMQSHGRGRRGSEWVSAPGAGLWFSLLLRPKLPAEAVAGLSLCVGLAVRDAIASRVTAPTLVKWPNDVWCGGRKLAGILIESQVSGSKISNVIVGIGINVEQTAFPEPITQVATSLALLSAGERGRESLLADVLLALQARLTQLEAEGMSSIAETLRPHDALLDQRLRIDGVEGTGAGIDAVGRLLVRSDDGSTTPFVTGHVELVTASS